MEEHGMDGESGNGRGRSFAAGLIIGGLVGAGLALLLAPQAGEDTRRGLARRARRLADGARDRYDEAKERVRRARAERAADREGGATAG